MMQNRCKALMRLSGPPFPGLVQASQEDFTRSPHRIAPFSSKEANMGRIPYVLALSLVLAASTRSPAQESTTSSSRPNLAEVRFGDGSNVRMTLLQENLEVQTKYGKLLIPVSEIRRVEFGLHVPPEVNQQITQSIKRLASDVYKERDLASK